VYLEVPADVALAACLDPGELRRRPPAESDPEALEECAAEVARRMNEADRPLVLAGVELLRLGLGREAHALVDALEVPFASTLSSKSVLPEVHPRFVGVYQGGWSRETVREHVEGFDCVLSLGVRKTDMDTGLFSARLDGPQVIEAAQGEVRIGHHFFRGVMLTDLMHRLEGLVRPRGFVCSRPADACPPLEPFTAEGSRPLTARRLYQAVDCFLDDGMVLLAEPGDAFGAAPELHVDEPENFVVQAYYSSIGYCTPASLGVGLARPGKRPVVLTGDGAFQMTVQEVSTLVRQHVPAVIVLIDNDGYLVERKLHRDGEYDDIQRWDYAAVPGLFGERDFTVGLRVETEAELAAALSVAATQTRKLVVVQARIPGRDGSEGLERLGRSFRAAERGQSGT
jgi:TPP-dependent 2-oxoacid decarboxylase